MWEHLETLRDGDLCLRRFLTFPRPPLAFICTFYTLGLTKHGDREYGIRCEKFFLTRELGFRFRVELPG